MNHQKDDVLQAAAGLWQDIILSLTNVDRRFFNGRHQPCQLCGGKDRARFIRKHEMQFHCNQCGDKSGLQFYMEYAGIGFSDAINDVGNYLGMIPVDRREAAKREHIIINQFPDWYNYDIEIYDSIKEAATVDLSAWQKINGLNMLDILKHGENALIPLLNAQGEPCDFVMLDIDGNMQTTSGNKSVPSGFHSVFGNEQGKRSYIAVSPPVSAHAAIFTGKKVICCYDVDNLWDVAKNIGRDWSRSKVSLNDYERVADEINKPDDYRPPVVICANLEDVQEADSLKFEQLMFNAKNNTVNRRLWKPLEYMDEREKVNDKGRSN